MNINMNINMNADIYYTYTYRQRETRTNIQTTRKDDEIRIAKLNMLTVDISTYIVLIFILSSSRERAAGDSKLMQQVNIVLRCGGIQK